MGGKGKIHVSATSLNFDSYYFLRSPPASVGVRIGVACRWFGSIGGYSLSAGLWTMSEDFLGKVEAVGAEVIAMEKRVGRPFLTHLNLGGREEGFGSIIAAGISTIDF